MSAPMSVTLVEWRPLAKNSLLGFATVTVGALKIIDVAVHQNGGKRWVNLPAKPMVTVEGVAMRDQRGKIRYVQVVEWTSKDAYERFTEGVLRALADHVPALAPS